MERLSRQVLKHGRTLLDKSQVYEVKIQAYIAQNRMSEAIAIAIEILKLMGIRMPARPTKLTDTGSFPQDQAHTQGKTYRGTPRSASNDRSAASRNHARIVKRR